MINAPIINSGIVPIFVYWIRKNPAKKNGINFGFEIRLAMIAKPTAGKHAPIAVRPFVTNLGISSKTPYSAPLPKYNATVSSEAKHINLISPTPTIDHPIIPFASPFSA